ncbi:hypothetical protein [Chishuiella sp.]|uniref:hypothetical protein n=1 Tax=Chishuiella sp. TaxID=1969467 RepID=UPI0028A6E24D|nr:hypothetical protein [Chishuiella sp.]
MKLLKKSFWLGLAIIFFNKSFFPNQNTEIIDYIALAIILTSFYFINMISFKNRDK